jgi:hypothetical protein
MAGAMVLTTQAAYSLLSAVSGLQTGSAIDSRARQGYYADVFCTGGSAVLTIQASPTIDGSTAWLPVQTLTALDGVHQSAVSLNPYPYLRAFNSGYAGGTASVYIVPGAA